METGVRTRFAEMAALPDEEIRLDEAALLIAAETESGIDIPYYLGALDTLAATFEEEVDSTRGMGVTVNSLIEFIHIREGFSGNVRHFFDPENSYLNRVIDTRTGIPISLALIHIALGSRLQLPVSGINFPGHFLVRYGTRKQVIVDPFTGRILGRPDCSNLLRQIAGPKAVLRDEYFQTAGNKDILIRILDNLKQIYWRQKSWDESKSCLTRQLLLLPNRAEFNIQLGAIYEMQGEHDLAQHVYVNVLRETQDDQIREVAGKRLLAMESRPATVH